MMGSGQGKLSMALLERRPSERKLSQCGRAAGHRKIVAQLRPSAAGSWRLQCFSRSAPSAVLEQSYDGVLAHQQGVLRAMPRDTCRRNQCWRRDTVPEAKIIGRPLDECHSPNRFTSCQISCRSQNVPNIDCFAISTGSHGGR